MPVGTIFIEITTANLQSAAREVNWTIGHLEKKDYAQSGGRLLSGSGSRLSGKVTWIYHLVFPKVFWKYRGVRKSRSQMSAYTRGGWVLLVRIQVSGTLSRECSFSRREGGSWHSSPGPFSKTLSSECWALWASVRSGSHTAAYLHFDLPTEFFSSWCSKGYFIINIWLKWIVKCTVLC